MRVEWMSVNTKLSLSQSPSPFFSEDPTQIGKGVAVITVLDINDNAPVFAIEYETLLCENAVPGQVRYCNVFPQWRKS